VFDGVEINPIRRHVNLAHHRHVDFHLEIGVGRIVGGDGNDFLGMPWPALGMVSDLDNTFLAREVIFFVAHGCRRATAGSADIVDMQGGFTTVAENELVGDIRPLIYIPEVELGFLEEDFRGVRSRDRGGWSGHDRSRRPWSGDTGPIGYERKWEGQCQSEKQISKHSDTSRS
jgi:hypothetical protein